MPAARKIRALVIEDNENDAILLVRELRRQGFEPDVQRVETPAQFTEALERGSWDVVLSDFYLPSFTVSEALGILIGRGLDLPFIVVSGSVGEEKAVEAMRAGADDYIFKNSLTRLGPALEREMEEASNRRARRRAEGFVADLNRDLQRRLAEQQAILDVVPMGIAITTDPACRIIHANPAFARALGLDPDANISLSVPFNVRPPFRILIGGVEVSPEELPMQRAARGERVANLEIEVVRADGGHVFFLSSASPLFDEAGHPRGAVGAFADVTEMKRAEVVLRNSEKLATVGRLAATIAHEINNPLESVTNILYLLARMPALDPQSRDLVAIAQQEMQRISIIVRQTLGFHREAATPVSITMAEVLDSVLNLYAPKIESLGIRVERSYKSRGEVLAFPGEIRQVLSNLIINAVDAMGRNGRLRLRVRDVSDGDSGLRCGVRVVVGDTGPGISPDVRRHIFEPFFTTKGEKGTGLGLWVSNGIVAKHGGRITLRSRTTEGCSGTVFSVFLPAGAAAASGSMQPGPPDASHAA